MELSSWFGLVNTLAHALMFINTKTAFSFRALIKTWYYLDRPLLFNGQCSCQIDRRTDRVILGFLCQMEGGASCIQGNEKIPEHKYRMLPISSGGKKIQPWFYSFFVAFIVCCTFCLFFFTGQP